MPRIIIFLSLLLFFSVFCTVCFFFITLTSLFLPDVPLLLNPPNCDLVIRFIYFKTYKTIQSGDMTTPKYGWGNFLFIVDMRESMTNEIWKNSEQGKKVVDRTCSWEGAGKRERKTRRQERKARKSTPREHRECSQNGRVIYGSEGLGKESLWAYEKFKVRG